MPGAREKTHLLIGALAAAIGVGVPAGATVSAAPMRTVEGVQVAQAAGAVAPRPGADPVIRQAQQALTALHIDPGPIDGLMGAKTRAAIREFQELRGLPPTGQLDAATWAALNPPR